MNDAERQARTAELLTEEAENPEGWWWLSFADSRRPAGSQFLGACLVRAPRNARRDAQGSRARHQPGRRGEGRRAFGHCCETWLGEPPAYAR